jgi:trans-aconitate methyltransferase
MDERLNQFYDDAIDRYGPLDPQGVGWGMPAGQVERFRVLSEIAPLEGASILDVGCGFGDLYGYLSEHRIAARYLGIDINPRSVMIARGKYPQGSFEAADFAEYDGPSADYVLCSGTLTFKIENYEEVYLGFIKKMFSLAEKGCAFNMLKRGAHPDTEEYAAYDPTAIYAFCEKLTKRLTLRQDYLANDFTMYLLNDAHLPES